MIGGICDAFGPRSRASRRATLRCLVLSASIAIAGCDNPALSGGTKANSELSISREGSGVYLISDRRTGCEYIVLRNGGIVLRSDGFGNVTPNCPGSHGYAKDFPYGGRK